MHMNHIVTPDDVRGAIANKYPDVYNFYRGKIFFRYSVLPFLLYGITQRKALQRAMDLFEVNEIYVNSNNLQFLPSAFLKVGIAADVSYGIAVQINRNLFFSFPEYFSTAEPLLRQWESQAAQPVLSQEEAMDAFYKLFPWFEDDNEEMGGTQEEMKNKKVEKNPAKRTTVDITMNKALQKYPRIMSQGITGGSIALRGSRERVPGTLKNWITSYQQGAGPAPHEPFERSQFLFHNQNALALSQEERNVLSGVLQAFDENTPIPIDSGAQRIALDKIEGEVGLRKPEPENRNAEPEKKPILNGEAARPAEAKEKVSFSEREPERYESIRQPGETPFSGNAKEAPQESEMPRDAEMTKVEKGGVYGQAQGMRMRGDAGVMRPSESVGEDEEISGSFIDKIARQQWQLQKAQSDLQEFGVQEGHEVADARRNDTSPQKGSAVHDFNQKETRENSLQGQFQNREAQFYKDVKTPSAKNSAAKDSSRPKRSLRGSAGKLSQREGTPGLPSGKFGPGAAGSREDFTDYYPIPEKKKSVAKMRFTERQRFGGELERKNASAHAAQSIPARSPGTPVSPEAKQKSESEGPQNGLIIE